MRQKLRDNSLSLVMFGVFMLLLLSQTLAGYFDYNEDQYTHQQPSITYAQYLGSSHLWSRIFENWESEFLQMAAYVILTVFLFQRGSAESKDPDKKEPVDEDPRCHQYDPKAPGPVRNGGLILTLYEHSLSIVLFVFFMLSFLGHAISGMAYYNHEQRPHGQATVSVIQYVGTSRFWFESFQNWQSEFLAVGVLIVLSIWLREKGSPESKPVYSPHEETGNH
jgi:tryptophan-rich sensory protein